MCVLAPTTVVYRAGGRQIKTVFLWAPSQEGRGFGHWGGGLGPSMQPQTHRAVAWNLHDHDPHLRDCDCPPTPCLSLLSVPFWIF